jgi:hypothetical protein
MRHVNERQPGDPRPDRAVCTWCTRTIERMPGAVEWTAAKVGVEGRDLQCPAAPNPDDGQMPGHQPNGVIIHPPPPTYFIVQIEAQDTADSTWRVLHRTPPGFVRAWSGLTAGQVAEFVADQQKVVTDGRWRVRVWVEDDRAGPPAEVYSPAP